MITCHQILILMLGYASDNTDSIGYNDSILTHRFAMNSG